MDPVFIAFMAPLVLFGGAGLLGRVSCGPSDYSDKEIHRRAAARRFAASQAQQWERNNRVEPLNFDAIEKYLDAAWKAK